MNLHTPEKPSMIRLNGADNVLVSTRIVEKGETTFEGVVTTAKIMRGHKMASTAIADGTPIRKFGQIIGFAKGNIQPGDWVHEHNVVMGELAHDYAFAQAAKQEPLLPESERATFQGYPPQKWQGGYAQLHRHHDIGELLGHGGVTHCPRSRAFRHAEGLPQY